MSQKTKAYVLPVPGRDAEVAELMKLIRSAGGEVVCAEEALSEQDRCIRSADVTVVLVCPETLDDKLVGPAVKLAEKLGKRAVAVWAADATPDELPTSLHRYGDSNIRLNEKEVARVVCGGETMWITTGGAPRPKQKAPRYKGH